MPSAPSLLAGPLSVGAVSMGDVLVVGADAQALPLKLQVLTRRADFLAANKGLRIARPGLVLQVLPNGGDALRFGITVTKKIGNAVVRNRMKRRFRALVREVLPQHGLAGHDHVLIGREGGVERDFALLRAELLVALERARAGKGDPPRKGHRPKGRGGKPAGKPKAPQPKTPQS
jgi:ribonuclease P protein component